jgi:2',3'-cyclic-nucleotide 2'-phosphodiesterase (5'-nucleotidase family)
LQGTIGAALLCAALVGGTDVPVPFAAGVARAAPPTISTANVRQSETEAGDLVADAVRGAAGADVALLPAAAFRPNADAPRPATAEQVTSLLDPPTDQVVSLNLRGSQVLQALERAVSFAPAASAGFLQVSGLRFTYDVKRDPGQRVVSATVDNKPLEAARSYRVATTRPLANGEQGYFQIWDKDQAVVAPGPAKTLTDAVAEWAKSHGVSMAPTTDGRITAVNK